MPRAAGPSRFDAARTATNGTGTARTGPPDARSAAGRKRDPLKHESGREGRAGLVELDAAAIEPADSAFESAAVRLNSIKVEMVGPDR